MNKLILLLVVILFTSCKEREQMKDSFFKDDIALVGRFDDEFRPESIPVIGKTKEEDVISFYPKGPNLRWSYKTLQTRKSHTGQCQFNRRLLLKQRSVSRIDGPDYAGYNAKEYIDFLVFLKDGIVSCYEIRHQVMGKDGEWEKGKYGTGYIWPIGKELEDILFAYWSQRTPEDREKYGITSDDVGRPFPDEKR